MEERTFGKPKKQVREAIHFFEPQEEWRREALHFDEQYRINADEEFRKWDEYVKSQNAAWESEEKDREQKTVQQSYPDKQIGAEVSNSLKDSAAAKAEAKKELSVSSEIIQPSVLDDERSEDHVERKKVSNPLYFFAAELQSDGTVSERHVPEEVAKAAIISEETLYQRTGNSAYELIHNGRIGKDIFGMIAQKTKKIFKTRKNELANFEVIPEKIVYYMNREGKRTGKGEVICYLTIKDESKVIRHEFRIKLEQIGRLTRYILGKFPEAIIYDPRNKSERAIENSFRKRIPEAMSEDCYINAGWNLMNGGHIYIFEDLKKQGIMINTTLNLPVNYGIRRENLPDIIEKISMLYKEKGTLYAMLTYSFLGVFYKVFEEAGYPPRFLLFLQGVSGSMKTSMAKVLYCQLCEDRYRQYPRRLDADTETSMERGLITSGQDTVTLFDDYAPPKTAQKGNEMRNKLETLIRIAGDGSTKSRSNISLEDRRGEGLKGMIVVTGELKETGLSSNLRCLHCEIKRDAVDMAILSWLQEQSNIYTTIIYHVTVYIADHWNELVKYIKGQYVTYRKEAQINVHVGRMVDTLATLWLIVDLVSMFLADYCGRSLNVEYIKDIKDQLHNLVIANEEMSAEEDPAETFVNALAEMINNNQMNIVGYKDRTEILKEADGYSYGGFYYLLPDRIYQRVVSWLGKCGKEFVLNKDQIIKALGDMGKIVTISNGAGKKTNFSKIKIDGRQVKLLKISENVLIRSWEKDSL